MEPQMSPEKKLEVMRRAIDLLLAKALKLDPKTLLLFSKLSPPVGRHLHAWTYPADAFLEGPGGSIAIAFRQESLEKMSLKMLIPILCHEMGHAALDTEKIRTGARVDESRAESVAKELLRIYGSALEALVKEAEGGA